VLIDQEWFQYNGRNDLFYPISRNAGWNLTDLREVSFAIKLGLNTGQILGANPVLRLCANPGNRIEFVPIANGQYVNLFSKPEFQDPNQWFEFTVPVDGNANWEVNVIGYIDPASDLAATARAKQELKAKILAQSNYVEISVRSDGNRGTRVSFYLDGLAFHLNPAP
jgi:hypothetical protein